MTPFYDNETIFWEVGELFYKNKNGTFSFCTAYGMMIDIEQCTLYPNDPEAWIITKIDILNFPSPKGGLVFSLLETSSTFFERNLFESTREGLMKNKNFISYTNENREMIANENI